jgi:hypothetical protein
MDIADKYANKASKRRALKLNGIDINKADLDGT